MSLPILDPAKVPDDWETDVFGLAHPPVTEVVVVRWHPPESVWAVRGDGTPMTEEETRQLMGRWTLEIRP